MGCALLKKLKILSIRRLTLIFKTFLTTDDADLRRCSQIIFLILWIEVFALHHLKSNKSKKSQKSAEICG
jgi:hypothetical protein